MKSLSNFTNNWEKQVSRTPFLTWYEVSNLVLIVILSNRFAIGQLNLKNAQSLRILPVIFETICQQADGLRLVEHNWSDGVCILILVELYI